MWIPTEEDPGFGTMANARAIAAGLTFRPIVETAKDTLAWLAQLPADMTEEQKTRARSTGIARDKEARALASGRLASGSQ